jgi:phage gpG-like protein
MDVAGFLKNVLNDLRVELADEFDRNFERKAFFDVPWAPVKRNIPHGSLMIRTGDLRKSIASKVSSNGIRFSSSLPYASLHNEGGVLTVSPAMKRYFWAMYYQAAGAISKKKDGTAANTQKNRALSAEAQSWKYMALMKVGTKITIPRRQFIGHHPQIDTIVHQVLDANVQELAESIRISLQNLHK